MKKVVFLVMVMAIGSAAFGGNVFSNAVSTSWDDVGNWSLGHVPNDSSTDPGSYVPQWGNGVEFATNARMVIGEGDHYKCYGFQLGSYGADNAVLDIWGGWLEVGDWGIDISRGNAGHGPMDGTVNMTGGLITSTTNLMVPQYWDNTGTASGCVGTINQSSGYIQVGDIMRIGMGDGVGAVNLSGNAVVNLGSALQMNTFWGGWDEPSFAMTASLVIDDSAYITIGGVGDYTPGEGDPTIEEVLAAEMDIYQAYIDFGWITSNTSAVTLGYNEVSDIITIVPEPATMMLLGLGGVLIRRKQ